MGTEQSKPKNKLAEINREVSSIRSSLRASNRSLSKETKNNIQENLVKYSNDVSELKGKVKNRQLDVTQKQISQTMKEVLTMESDLDKAAVETDSIVQIPSNKSRSIENPKIAAKSKNQSKSLPSLSNIPTLQDIENRLKSLRSQIKAALDTEDTTQLRVHQETLRVLATSLELIDVPEYTPLGDKKKKLDSTVMAQYQKINKALRDIRRNRDIKYLSKQKQKEDILRELDIISGEIEKYDSLSRQAFKNGDFATIKDVHQNLKKINRRLSSIENIDENTKTLKLQMKDKISWLVKYITESAHKGSQSDLTKAQSDYEDIIKDIASGGNKSEDEIKEKLAILQNFTSSIDSHDEDNIRKKNYILNNINQSLTTLNENRLENKSNTVDIGQLERKASFDEEMLVRFRDTWAVLENALQHSRLTRETIQQIDSSLSEVQNAIMTTRKALIMNKSFQKTQKSSFSASVPNLSSVQTVSKQNEVGKAECDHNQTSKENCSDLVKLSGTTQNGNNKNKRQDERRFSRINEIKTQVYYIKEKFENSIQKPNLKTKLEDYIKTLQEYIRSDNQVIANNAKILLSEVEEIIKNIDRTMSTQQEKLPMEYYTDILARIEQNVTEIEKSAKQFQMDRNYTAYLETKKLLNEAKDYMVSIDIPEAYEAANQHRYHLMNKIDQIIVDCEEESSIREKAYVKEVRNILDTLKDKINRFSGPYKGVLYNAIEKDLNKILVHADANILNKSVSDQIVKDTEKFLKILEHRATKDQSFRYSKEKGDSEKMSVLKEELKLVKNNIDDTPTDDTDKFISLNSRLDLIKLTLDQIKHVEENIENQKEIIYNEIETLKNVVEAKIVLGQQDINHTSLEEFNKRTTEENDKRITEELDKIELTFGKLKYDIKTFVGTKSDKKYFELDESTMKLLVKLDDIKLSKGTPLFNRKKDLLDDIQRYEDLLDKRTQETEHLTQFESDVNDIEENFSRYTKSIKDLDSLAETINNLKLKLMSSEYSSPLSERKNVCINRMTELESKIQIKTKESIVIEESLLQVKYSLEVMKKEILTRGNFSTDLSKKLSSMKVELEDMTDLNQINLKQKAELLRELESLENNLVSNQNLTQKHLGNVSTAKTNIKSKFERELLEIEQTMNRFKNEIQFFMGTTKDGKFFELDEGINKLIMKLDDMKLNKSSSCYDKKVELLKNLNYLSELLDKRADDTEILLQFEEDVADIEADISNVATDSIIKKITVIEESDLINDLLERKTTCIQKLKKLLEGKEMKNISSKLSSVEGRITELENQIDEFDGTIPESNYSNIDNSLQELFSFLENIPLPLNSDHYENKNKVLDRIQNMKSVLKDKRKENELYNKFIDELNTLKEQMNATTNRNSLMQFSSKLKYIQADAEKSSLREKLKNEIHKKCTLLLQSYSDKINSLPNKSYIGSADFLKDVEMNTAATSKPKFLSDSFNEECQALSEEINQMTTKIEEFMGDETSGDYKKLEDDLLKINVRVKKLKDLNESVHIMKKLELKNKVVGCLTKLDEKVQDYEILTEVERELAALDKKLKNNIPQKEDRESIDEKLISLQLSIGKLNSLNKSLNERKNIVIQKIVSLMKLVKQSSADSNSEDSGTSI